MIMEGGSMSTGGMSAGGMSSGGMSSSSSSGSTTIIDGGKSFIGDGGNGSTTTVITKTVTVPGETIVKKGNLVVNTDEFVADVSGTGLFEAQNGK